MKFSPKVIATTIEGQAVEVERAKLTKAVHCYAICVRDNKVLISPQHRDDGFVFPGGHVELGEDHLEGLVREVKEETGYIIKPNRVLHVFTSIYMSFKRNKAQHSTLIFYTADVIRGRLSTDGFDVHERSYAKQARWVTLDEMKTMKFTCNIQEPIKAITKYLELLI
jgi:8-oxo-dGTP pyrophosphatase MutT (NUDIX family)